MRKEDRDKIRFFLDHPGMFFDEQKIEEAISFVYAMSYWVDDKPLEGFFDWLIEAYLDDTYRLEYSSRGWGHLVQFIPKFSTEDGIRNTQSFVADVEKFLMQKGHLKAEF